MSDPISELTVAQVVIEYLAAKVGQMRAGLAAKGTVIRVHFYCGKFSEDFGHLQLTQCRRGDLVRWLTMHPEFKSPHTKRDAAGCVVTAFRWAVEDGLIVSCPYAMPRDLPVPEPRQPVTPGEVRQILISARDYGHRPARGPFRLAIWFLWETGCRTCEMRGLRWEHYDDARGCFEVAGKTTRRTGRKRLLVLNRRAWRFIRWLRRGQTSGPVFRNGRGRAWAKDTFTRLFRRHANAADVRKEVTAYTLRHGFCCELLESGVGERQIADLMGHASTKLVSWYGRGVQSRVDYLRDVSQARRR